jgi:REP element-mobilizing transposase RayT
MPKRDIEFLKGAYYHIYNRGAGRHNLFIEEDNYQYVLRRIKKYIFKLSLTVIAYCLMPNHYHLLIRQDGDTSASELPKCVFGGYSRAVNKRYGWSGTLFEGRYKAKTVTSNTYLCQLCGYIHGNPVKDGLMRNIEDWPYSNYLEWIGEREGSLIDRKFVTEMFGSTQSYQEYVLEYLAARQLPTELKYLNDF